MFYQPRMSTLAPRVARCGGGLAIAAAGAALAGAAAAAQVQVNAGLAGHLGSPVDAATVSFAGGWLVLLVVVLARRGRRAAGGAARTDPPRAPTWAWLAGLGGACYVAVAAWAAPRVGVALVAVATVAGQSLGALVADLAGLGVSGRRVPGRTTLAAAALTVAAVVVTRLDRATATASPTLLLVLAAGAAIAVQAALLGHLNRATGGPVPAALVNYSVGAAALAALAVTIAVTGPGHPRSWPADPLAYLGGLCGALIVVLTAAAVARLGVLRLTVMFTAGQLACGVLLDLLGPHAALTPGRAAGIVTISAATLLAVRRPRPQPPSAVAPVEATLSRAGTG